VSGPDVTNIPDFSGVDVWIFDLDNTLYPAESQFMGLVEVRMTDFVERLTGLPREEARALQKKYLMEQGTTLAGLMANHGVSPHEFMDFVHDVPLDRLQPDSALHAALARLPGRRLVFTNGSAKHARRVLDRLELAPYFEDIFHIETAGFVPKPAPETFDAMLKAHAVDPRRAAFFEDSERNLKPAADLGMTTVLVGARAAASEADFVQYRTAELAPFLNSIRVRKAA
jgi:putative hydrolase of the HAD superfamily